MFESEFAVQENIVSRSNQDGTVVIMKMDDGNTFFKINGVAAMVWKELSKSRKINEITKEIIENYNAPESVILSDINNFLQTLLQKELIKKN